MSARAAVRRYRFLGLNLLVSGPEVAVDALHSRLAYFPPAEAHEPADLAFHFSACDGAPHTVVRPAGAARRVAPPRDDAFDLDYFEADDCLYISDRDEIRALCEPRRSSVHISVPSFDAENIWMATRPVFVVSLFELMKRRGCFNIHAAGLGVGNRIVLLAGHSGSGKSTLAAVLCRAGFEFMADDYVFLTHRPEGLRVLGFPEELEMCEDAPALMPELRAVFAPGLQGNTRSANGSPQGEVANWWKRQVRAEDHWDTSLVWEGTAALVVFPTVAQSAVSVFERMAPGEAVAQLVCNVQYTRPDLAQAHVEALGALVQNCPCYRLHTGRDLETVSESIRALVKSHGLPAGS